MNKKIILTIALLTMISLPVFVSAETICPAPNCPGAYGSGEVDENNCSVLICPECGNGECEGTFEEQTCPEDCELCADVGDVIDILIGDIQGCCSGLTKIDYYFNSSGIGIPNSCYAPCPPGICFICTDYCGNGECGEYENWCNCEKDCPEPAIVLCTDNSTCGKNICQQGRTPDFQYACYEDYFICQDDGMCIFSRSEPFINWSCGGLYDPTLSEDERAKCHDFCGDGICKFPEHIRTCVEDCGGGNAISNDETVNSVKLPDADSTKQKNVEAISTKKVSVVDSKVYFETSEGAKEINIFPEDISLITTISDIEEMKITEENGKVIYLINGKNQGRLFFIFPVSVITTEKINAENGEIISTKKPWWSFLVDNI